MTDSRRLPEGPDTMGAALERHAAGRDLSAARERARELAAASVLDSGSSAPGSSFPQTPRIGSVFGGRARHAPAVSKHRSYVAALALTMARELTPSSIPLRPRT